MSYVHVYLLYSDKQHLVAGWPYDVARFFVGVVCSDIKSPS